MNLSVKVLGQSTVSQLQERASTPVLRIGADAFTRHDLAAVDCFNFTAAANLSRILNAELRVKNTRDVFDNIDPTGLVLPRLGAVSLAVLGAAFEAKQLGGERSLEAWVVKHRAKDAKREFVTFDSMKQKYHRDALAAANERKDEKRRKSTRRNQAHRLRVDRHQSRLQQSSES